MSLLPGRPLRAGQPPECANGRVNPSTGKALKTTLWGYGSTTQAPSYPGRSFNVRRDVPITGR
jgi:hypothetical protein